VKPGELSKLSRTTGDLGDAAYACKSQQQLLVRPEPLTLRGVHEALLQLSKHEGQGSAGRKTALMASLIRACRGCESKFLVRTLVRHIRTGATLVSVLAALAAAVVLHTESGSSSTDDGRALSERIMASRIAAAQSSIKDCYNLCPDLPTLCSALIEGGLTEMVKRCTAGKVGSPVRPMLAKPSTGVDDLLKAFQGQPFLIERKYDGQRAQIHVLASGEVIIYSRKLENMTEQYGDVVAAVTRAVSRSSSSSSSDNAAVAAAAAPELIIDAEIVAVDPAQDFRLLPFQSLSSRPRKGNAGNDSTAAAVTVTAAAAPGVAVCVMAFDLLAHNGALCLQLPLEQRRQLLREATANAEHGRFMLATALICHAPPDTSSSSSSGSDTAVTSASSSTAAADSVAATAGVELCEEPTQEAQLMAFLQDSIAASCEGLMAKSLGPNSVYAPGGRTAAWVKLKRDYIAGMADTFDLVPIGAWHGNGRKAQWLSPVLLACYDPSTGELQSLCRKYSIMCYVSVCIAVRCECVFIQHAHWHCFVMLCNSAVHLLLMYYCLACTIHH
jgi:DNA ligase 1